MADSCGMWLNNINAINKAALNKWLKETGISLVQINGQRKFGGPPPGWIGEAPASGSEVFIGKLPQDIYEDKLIPLFQTVGTLYEFRLMMTFSGINRGFAYARYTNKRHANAAISAFNGFEIQKDCLIVVCRSTEKCELTLDGFPCFLDESTLKTILQDLTCGVMELSLYPSLTKKGELMAVVKYSSHRAAAMAKKKIIEESQIMNGYPLTVDWLKSDTKQKLRKTEKHQEYHKEHSSLKCLWDMDAKELTTHDILSLVCQKVKLGQPIFVTKFLNLSSCGWLRFWYHVVIPGYSVPFSGFAWLIGESLTPAEKHEKAKEVVAGKILAALGYVD